MNTDAIREDLEKVKSSDLFRIPGDRVLAMIQECARQVSYVSTLDDAKEVASVAEAIAAVSKKLDIAKGLKESAVKLVVEAEAKLGEIIRAVPHASPSTPAKRDVLREHGINKRRASVAERLATTPKEDIERAVSEGARSLHGVTVKLGIHSDGYTLRTNKAEAMAFLCEEAVTLLVRCVREKKVPHEGTVVEMAKRLRTIQAHGNAR